MPHFTIAPARPRNPLTILHSELHDLRSDTSLYREKRNTYLRRYLDARQQLAAIPSEIQTWNDYFPNEALNTLLDQHISLRPALTGSLRPPRELATSFIRDNRRRTLISKSTSRSIEARFHTKLKEFSKLQQRNILDQLVATSSTQGAIDLQAVCDELIQHPHIVYAEATVQQRHLLMRLTFAGLVMTDSHQNSQYPIALDPMQLDITITANGGLSRIAVKGTTFMAYTNNAIHPHDMGGNFCFGGFATPISNCLAAGNLTGFVYILMTFLQQYNSDDSAGRTAWKWLHPHVEAQRNWRDYPFTVYTTPTDTRAVAYDPHNIYMAQANAGDVPQNYEAHADHNSLFARIHGFFPTFANAPSSDRDADDENEDEDEDEYCPNCERYFEECACDDCDHCYRHIDNCECEICETCNEREPECICPPQEPTPADHDDNERPRG